MTKALLPQAFWFRIAAPCPRVEDMPVRDGRRRLLDLPPSCRLPEGARLEGRSPWAEVRVGWNPRGLGIVVQAEGLGRPEAGRGSARGLRRRPVLGGHARHPRREPGDAVLPPLRGRDPPAEAGEEPRRRGRPEADRPRDRRPADGPGRPDRSPGRPEPRRLDARGLPAGTGPERLRPRDQSPARLRLPGLRPLREDQFLGVGRDFPIGENPSLWSTLELKD